MASAMRRVLTLAANAVVPVNLRLCDGLRTLALAEGRGDPMVPPLVGPHKRPAAVSPPLALKLPMAGPTQVV
jgi:hypothetical protein